LMNSSNATALPPARRSLPGPFHGPTPTSTAETAWPRSDERTSCRWLASVEAPLEPVRAADAQQLCSTNPTSHYAPALLPCCDGLLREVSWWVPVPCRAVPCRGGDPSMACKGSGVQIPSAPPQVRRPLRRRPPANRRPCAAATQQPPVRGRCARPARRSPGPPSPGSSPGRRGPSGYRQRRGRGGRWHGPSAHR
jgi:hypothetical protein